MYYYSGWRSFILETEFILKNEKKKYCESASCDLFDLWHLMKNKNSNIFILLNFIQYKAQELFKTERYIWNYNDEVCAMKEREGDREMKIMRIRWLNIELKKLQEALTWQIHKVTVLRKKLSVWNLLWLTVIFTAETHKLNFLPFFFFFSSYNTTKQSSNLRGSLYWVNSSIKQVIISKIVNA